MREAKARLYVHLVWATWDRQPFLTPGHLAALGACVHAECRKLGVDDLAWGGVSDHVHLLVRVPPAIAVSALVKQVKGVSSHLATHCLNGLERFKWQGGYAAFSVSPAHVGRVSDYIIRQPERHERADIWPGCEPGEPEIGPITVAEV